MRKRVKKLVADDYIPMRLRVLALEERLERIEGMTSKQTSFDPFLEQLKQQEMDLKLPIAIDIFRTRLAKLDSHANVRNARKLSREQTQARLEHAQNNWKALPEQDRKELYSPDLVAILLDERYQKIRNTIAHDESFTLAKAIIAGRLQDPNLNTHEREKVIALKTLFDGASQETESG